MRCSRAQTRKGERNVKGRDSAGTRQKRERHVCETSM
jgi:hypothetical protein